VNTYDQILYANRPYAQTHPDEIRALPGGNVPHLPVWSSSIDRVQLLQLAKYAKQFGVITSLPNFTQLFPSDIRTGFASGLLEASVGKVATIKQAGKLAARLDPGSYILIVKDTSRTAGFKVTGGGLTKATGIKAKGTFRFTVNLASGKYRWSATGKAKGRGTFVVTK